ncbi:hypothetical protein [Ruixingdingia sedimenti]|uniref:Tail terminator n=1 Tax=Ruixingdingia sedimenti TaxID=3073604 RepID=A0ABU1FDF4_9RHOB|nr:hypothetical protein [Xinfangfangia sp. LG-4]MDR5654877.1 hypothetical protein [Xinfangfangia sp. LG-4]
MAELERCLKTIPGLRVERDTRQPEDHEDLRANGPLAILYSGERENVELGNGDALTWAWRWQLKPMVTVLISEPDEVAQRETLEEIEDAFIAALDASRLNGNDLLVQGSVPKWKTLVRHPDESDLAGMEILLDLTYDR